MLISSSFLLLQFAVPIAIGNYPIFGEHAIINSIVYNICDWIYSFGCIVCHQRADRSWFICGTQMPICVRCLGMTIGIFISSVISFIIVPDGKLLDNLKRLFFIEKNSNNTKLALILAIFMFPMIIDGFSQIIFDYSSIEITRILTGLLFGYFEGSVFLSMVCPLILLGKTVANWISNNYMNVQ